MDAKAIADARSFLRAFRSVMAFAETIEQIGTLETDMATVQAAYEQLIADMQNVRGELEIARAENARVHEEADNIRAEARKEAKRLKDQANIAATAAGKKSTEECAMLVEKAQAEASAWDKRVQVARDEFQKTKAELTEVEKQLASAKVQLSELLARFK